VAGYELRITPSAAKEFDALPRKKDREAVASRIRALADEPRPRGAVKLSGEQALYRVRQGRLRIVYAIEDDRLIVVVIRIKDRKDAYRKELGARSYGGTRPFRRLDDDEG
jgi:mRNA interferase RelE/StbE